MDINDVNDSMNIFLSKLFVGPDSIFRGDVVLLNANIFKTNTYSGALQELADAWNNNQYLGQALTAMEKPVIDLSATGNHLHVKIKEAIGNIYVILRNLCAYIMLAGLIFTGIRVLVSSNIPDKRNRWLSMISDWVIGMILLIFSHVIMVGIFYVSDILVNAISLSLIGTGGINAQLMLQCLLSLDFAEQLICIVMLGYLIYLTVLFTFSYLKRFIWITILIVIAPIVSIMYAFGNTKSIYSKWLREYITTVLIQPFHLIVYYILISIPLNLVNSAGGFSLTANNSLEIIYALIAMSFIKPAEKYVRDLFGMGGGIAGFAAPESGKMVLDKTIGAIGKVAMLASTAGVGGAAMATGKAALTSAANARGIKGLAAKGLMKEGKAVEKGFDFLTNGFSKNGRTSAKAMSEAVNYGKPKDKEEDKAIEKAAQNASKKPTTNSENTDDLSSVAANQPKQSTNNAQYNNEQTSKNNNGVFEAPVEREEKGKLGKLSDFMKVATGNKGLFDALDGSANEEVSKFMSSELGQSLKKFEEIGGMKEAYVAFNEIRDAFSPGPSGDWRPTSERMEQSIKEMIDQRKFEFTNNDGNIQLMLKNENLIEKMREQYPDKSEAYISVKAEEIAKDKLKSLADTYVPLGVTDMQFAYECNKDRKKYGLTAQQAVASKVEFERINVGTESVQQINNIYQDIDKGKEGHVEIIANSVVEAIPDARQYFENGCRDVESITKAAELKQLLNVSIQEAASLHRGLKKNHGVLKGTAKEIEQNPELSRKLSGLLDTYKKENIVNDKG